MPPKKTPAPTTTPAPAEEPEPAEQSQPEHGFLEIRCIPGRNDLELWISNRKVYGSDNAHDIVQQIGRMLNIYAYKPDRMPNHITLLHARIEGLPTEDEWPAFDAQRRAAAQSQNAPPPTPSTATAPPPAESEDSDG